MDFLQLIDTLVEKLNMYHSVLEGNEAQTRWMLIDVMLLEGLGFNREDITVEYNIDTISRVNKYNKLDYCISINNRPKILIEAKSLGVNLFEKYDQLEEYFLEILKLYDYKKRELIGVLTDGDTYLFYTNSLEVDRMDDKPFLSIRLSVSEDFMRQNLLDFNRNTLKSKIVDIDNTDYEEEYDIDTEYRIDSVEGAINYFNSQGQKVEINKVYINGRYKPNIKSFRTLYRYLLDEINIRKPDFLYVLAKQEDINTNGRILNMKFSCKKINSSDIKFKTKDGEIYVTLPNSTEALINRIVYLVKVSDFGLHNITVSLKMCN